MPNLLMASQGPETVELEAIRQSHFGSTTSCSLFTSTCSSTVLAPRGQVIGELGDFGDGAEADQEAGVVGGLQAAAPLALADDRPAAGLDLDPGADGVAVAHGADELQADPVVVAGWRVVAEDARGRRPCG